MLAVGDDVLAALNLGRAIDYMKWSRFHDALVHLDAANAQLPGDLTVHWNKAMCLLSLGNYLDGFQEFEYRLSFYDWPWALPRPTNNGMRRWSAGELADKSILLVHDGGRGDAIMMLRFIPKLKQQGAKLTLLLRPEVARLAEQFDVEVIPVPVPEHFDIICPTFSLPFMLSETVETVPRAPYLQVTPRGCGRRIGLCWSGVSQHQFTCEKLLDLIGLDPNEIQSLQPGPTIRGVAALPVGDFFDVAELIMGLEHIITVDTAVANLAGALGHPSTHLLLKTIMDFRWWRAAVWYPTVNCYRQAKADDWTDPLRHLRTAIPA